MARTFASGGAGTDRIAVANYAAINSLVTFSLSVWVYGTGAGGGSNGRILDKRATVKTNSLFIFYYNSSFWEFDAEGWATTVGSWTVTRPSDSAWHHVLVTYDYGSTSNNPVVYIDGVSVSVSRTATPAGTHNLDTSDFYIGNSGNPASTRAWDGRLAEVAVWNAIRSAVDAMRLAGGVAPDLIDPSHLVLYVPVSPNADTSPEPNVAPGYRAQTGTVVGTSQVAHPTIPITRRLLTGSRSA